MFQMIDDQKPTAEDRKMIWVKIGVFLVLFAALGGVVYRGDGNQMSTRGKIPRTR